MKRSNFGDDFDEQIEMFLESVKHSTEQCSSLKKWKKKKSKPSWLHKKVKNAFSEQMQTMKHFRELLTALNKIRLPEIGQETFYTVKEAKFNHFSNVSSKCMKKPQKLYKTFNEKTGKRSVKTNLKKNMKTSGIPIQI